MRFLVSSLGVGALLLGLWVYSSKQVYSCEVTRAAFDVGSGSTKMRVYEFDTCTNKIIRQVKAKGELLCEANEKVDYKQSLVDAGTLTPEVVDLGTKVLKKQKQIAMDCGASDFVGVATSAFRQAKNGSDVLKRLSKNAGVNVFLVSQEEEGRLGYAGAVSLQVTSETEGICVWDIGGSSQQIICSSGAKFLSQLAAVPFKELIMKFKSEKSGQNVKSPNPIGVEAYSYGLTQGVDEAKKMPADFVAELKSSLVLGIGGVHYYALSKAMGLKEYTADDLSSYAEEKLSMTDAELGGGDFVQSSVSNLILVESLMRGMGIQKIKALNVNLTEGLVASKKYWP